MNNLLINRINLKFNRDVECHLNISKPNGFVLLGSTVVWTKGKLPPECADEFSEWLGSQGVISECDFLCFDFSSDQKDGCFSVKLNSKTINPFKSKIFIQELGHFFIEKGFYIDPTRKAIDFSAYQRIGNFDQIWERYRRIDFKWKSSRKELSFNIGSESSLISLQKTQPRKGQKIISEETQLIYRSTDNEDPRKVFPAEKISQGTPKKFKYNERYKELKKFAFEYFNEFRSEFFSVDSPELKTVDPSDVQMVFSRQNRMVFGGGKKVVNAAMGMREFGPYKKLDNANRIKLLFIYQNRDDANNLYAYLRNGLKHFPGLLSYTGIPVALPDYNDSKGIKYSTPDNLPKELADFLEKEYPEDSYSEIFAIVIEPSDKNDSTEEESKTYYKVKKLLLEKSISSQFISIPRIKDVNFHYALPNIAIAILAKLGGIPWKLDVKRFNELVIGFNTKKYGEETFLGSAVFFNNEGELGKIQGFPQSGSREIIKHLKRAIDQYINEVDKLDRLVIHYYKPPQKDELKRIETLLKQEFNLPIPFAVVEVNDSKTKMEICFDAEYDMGMPESGTYVKVGWDEYLLFNNTRYQKKPARRVEEVLPIKVKISFADTGGFHHKELITQVYEFSRIYWKGLKQQSQPVSTKYSKMIADFAAMFGGDIPDNTVAQRTPWFI